jgi:hypothetical protein
MGLVTDEMINGTPIAVELIERSFFSESAKRKHIEMVGYRRRKLQLQ